MEKKKASKSQPLLAKNQAKKSRGVSSVSVPIPLPVCAAEKAVFDQAKRDAEMAYTGMRAAAAKYDQMRVLLYAAEAAYIKCLGGTPAVAVKR